MLKLIAHVVVFYKIRLCCGFFPVIVITVMYDIMKAVESSHTISHDESLSLFLLALCFF